MKNKRCMLIACEIMFREICFCASKCKNVIDIKFMSKGLHDLGEVKMSERLQKEIDKVDTEKYDYILICYGLCNNGIKGLHSKLPMIMPRAHDCITLLLGSRNKYNKYFNKNPRTFFKSPGWVERDINPNENAESVTSQLGLNKTYQEYLDEYGEENAKYLMEMAGDWLVNYEKIAYIDTNICDSELYKNLSKQQADENQWEYEEIEGSTNLIFRLLDGEWDQDDFIIVPPNNKIIPSYGEDIISYVPV